MNSTYKGPDPSHQVYGLVLKHLSSFHISDIQYSHKHSTIIVKILMKRDKFRMKNETNNNTKE